MRFEGPAAELAERDDLARAVFLGTRGRLSRGGRRDRGSRRSSSSTGWSPGSMIGLLAMGIVLIYRSTRVINFAVGNMGLVGASLLALLVIEYGIPFWLAAIGIPGRRHAVRRGHGAGR